VLTAHFAEQLPLYEKQEAAMRMYFPDLIAAINLRKEEQRLEKLEFTKTKRERIAKPVAQPPPAEKKPWQLQLEKAEKFYDARDMDKAREAYAAVIPMSPDKPVHAQAYFGLGLIAARKPDFQLAEDLFKKSLELDPPAHERSWAYYYLARLAWAAGEVEPAANHYKSALAVPGASSKLRDVARKGLEETQQKK